MSREAEIGHSIEGHPPEGYRRLPEKGFYILPVISHCPTGTQKAVLVNTPFR